MQLTLAQATTTTTATTTATTADAATPAGFPMSLKGVLQSPMLPFAFMIPVFYLLMIRPQQKQQKQFQVMLTQLKPGDNVITRAGFHGKIFAIDNSVVQVEIAKSVIVTMNKDQIAGLQTTKAAA